MPLMYSYPKLYKNTSIKETTLDEFGKWNDNMWNWKRE